MKLLAMQPSRICEMDHTMPSWPNGVASSIQVRKAASAYPGDMLVNKKCANVYIIAPAHLIDVHELTDHDQVWTVGVLTGPLF